MEQQTLTTTESGAEKRPEMAENGCLPLRTRILDQARLLFNEHGYSKVSATEISQSLGISKKTLYKEFETKEDILKAVILPKLANSERDLDAILEDPKLTYIERLREVMTLIGMQYKRVSHVLIRDVYAHAPEVWQSITNFRERRVEKFAELLKQGTREGVFRSEIDPQIVMALYQSAVDAMMDPKVLMELPGTPRTTFEMILTILLQGILRDDLRQQFKTSEQQLKAREQQFKTSEHSKLSGDNSSDAQDEK
jgi:AcrR family transcriptional regulator